MRPPLVLDEPAAAVYAHIGNVIRLAAVLEVEEAEGACEQASEAPPQLLLLDPLQVVANAAQMELNRRLLEAFRAFRQEIVVALESQQEH